VTLNRSFSGSALSACWSGGSATFNSHPTVASLADACLSTAHLHVPVTGGVAPYTWKRDGQSIVNNSAHLTLTAPGHSHGQLSASALGVLLQLRASEHRARSARSSMCEQAHVVSSTLATFLTDLPVLQRLASALQMTRLHNWALAGITSSQVKRTESKLSPAPRPEGLFCGSLVHEPGNDLKALFPSRAGIALLELTQRFCGKDFSS
jgi:hypothetical protein